MDNSNLGKETGHAPEGDGVRVENLEGRQELIVPGRFELSWAPEAVDERTSEEIEAFQYAVSRLISYAHDELSDDPETRARVVADRQDRVSNLATVMRIPGSSIAYPDRNTRYTSMDGSTLMPEEIVPGNGMDEPNPRGGIPNPLNLPKV